MPAPREPELLVRAARLYHLEGYSQQEVARELGTSRSNVSRMLAAALELGIVEIRIHDPAGRDQELEQALRTRFGLDEAVVAARGEDRPLDRVGQLAATWLLGSIKDGMTVALSWGHALQSMVWATTTDQPIAVELVQLVGGLSSVASEITGQELVRELAARLGASYRYLHAPAVLTSPAGRDALLAERSIAASLDAARSADIAVVGVGTAGYGSSAAVLKSLQLTPEERAAYEAAAPVGDLAARFFDAEGRAVGGPVADRVLAVSLDDIRRIPTVVGVAAGREKARGLHGALAGGLLDVLICDQAAARGVLGMTEEES